MNKIRLFTVPNIITGLNLFSGCIACVYAFHGNYDYSLYFIILSAVFDFFDGMAARLLNSPSLIGKELDSLADDISFGLAPSLIVFSFMKDMDYSSLPAGFETYLPFAAFIISVASAFRLAKFNIDERQTTSFIGLPTPANALFWASLVAGKYGMIINSINPLVAVVLILVFSWLLVSEIPMFSLKFKSLLPGENKVRYLFLITSVIILVLLGIAGLAAVIGWYIILSLLTASKVK